MRKWKHVCRLKTKLNNIKTQWKSDHGITLVELLAALAILSVVILLAGSVNIFGQKQFINQTESASQSNDMSYALSVMSQELRKVEGKTISVTEDGRKISTENDLTFELQGDQLLKNENVLIDGVSSMKAKLNGQASIEITLKTKSKRSKEKVYQTAIYFRR